MLCPVFTDHGTRASSLRCSDSIIFVLYPEVHAEFVLLPIGLGDGSVWFLLCVCVICCGLVYRCALSDPVVFVPTAPAPDPSSPVGGSSAAAACRARGAGASITSRRRSGPLSGRATCFLCIEICRSLACVVLVALSAVDRWAAPMSALQGFQTWGRRSPVGRHFKYSDMY